MNCIVIDDEPLAREGMSLLIKDIPDLKILSSFSNIPEADVFLSFNEVDIIFLDIQMPLMTGLDYLKISINRPLIVITTAFPEYAIQGFEFDVVDYLTKPIRFERFYKAVSKCRKLFELTKLNQDESFDSKINDSIFIRSNRKYIKVIINQISYIEALKDYVLVHYDKSQIPVSINLKSIENKLPKDKFIRVNKSYIVNTDFIKSIDNDLIELSNCEITIGDHYKDNVLKYISGGKVIKRDY